MRDVNRATWSLRLGLVCLAAVSVSLPMAWISLAKVLVFLCALVGLIGQVSIRRTDSAIQQLWTPWAVMLLLVCSACSLLWSDADLPSALVTLVKHAKLLEVVLLVILVRTAAEARVAITAFACGQAFMLLSSWLMFAGFDLPWNAQATTPYVVFSTYLDQSIMFAASASVFWHLRNDGLWHKWLGISGAVLALANVFLLLEGRTGYLVALTSVSLALMWTLPRHLRLRTFVITPLVVFGVMFVSSTQWQERVLQVVQESQDYAHEWDANTMSSSGWRLNAWHHSLRAIKESPLAGYGVGAWPVAVKRIEGSAATQVFGEGNSSNPHQEYLLWGVELGVGGLLMFLATLVCVIRDALLFPRPIKRATLAVLVAIVIACLFNSALYDDLLGDFLVVTLGLLMALGTRSMVINDPQTGGKA
jgi:O-antigen ligase